MSEKTPHWLTKRASISPEATGLVFEEKSYTYKELEMKAKQTAGKLATLGVKKHDFIGVLLPNGVDFTTIVYGLSYLGATVVCLNTRLTTKELSNQLKGSNARFLFTTDSFKRAHDFSEEIVYTIEELHSQIREQIEYIEEINLSDPFTMMYTSGTTGQPKGVIHTYGNHWASATASALNLGLERDDAWLGCLPMFHIGGFSLIVRTVIYGIPLYLFEKFTLKDVHKMLMSGKVTLISVVGIMLERLLENMGSATYPPEVRCFLVGGSAVGEAILLEAKVKKVPVFQSYGLTETTSQLCTLNAESSMERIGSSGKPLFSADLKIVDSDEDGVGEVIVRGPMVVSGYHENEVANREQFIHGWLYTGDVGRLDEAGYLYVLDRRKDLIISGGENIYPKEIEQVLEKFPEVVAAGVIGIRDEKWGRVPVAFIEVQTQLDIADLMLFLKTELASYKCPQAIYPIKALPRNAMGKLLRRSLYEYL